MRRFFQNKLLAAKPFTSLVSNETSMKFFSNSPFQHFFRKPISRLAESLSNKKLLRIARILKTLLQKRKIDFATIIKKNVWGNLWHSSEITFPTKRKKLLRMSCNYFKQSNKSKLCFRLQLFLRFQASNISQRKNYLCAKSAVSRTLSSCVLLL